MDKQQPFAFIEKYNPNRLSEESISFQRKEYKLFRIGFSFENQILNKIKTLKRIFGISLKDAMCLEGEINDLQYGYFFENGAWVKNSKERDLSKENIFISQWIYDVFISKGAKNEAHGKLKNFIEIAVEEV